MRMIDEMDGQPALCGGQVQIGDWQTLVGNLLTQNEVLTKEVQRLSCLCEQDALLNILNRRGLERALLAEISKVTRCNTASSFIFIDIDHFKEINDQYGHLEGDETLKRLSRHIQGRLRNCDQFARLGGDEFGIILPHTTLLQAIDKAEKMSISLVCAAKNWGKGACRLSFSAGVSEIGAHQQLDEIILQADQQMYLQKRKKP